MVKTIFNLLNLKSYAISSSPFVVVDETFIEHEKRRVKIARHVLRLSFALFISSIILIQGAVLLFSFSANAFAPIFGVFDLFAGVHGVSWFIFLLVDAIDDLKRNRRKIK